MNARRSTLAIALLVTVGCDDATPITFADAAPTDMVVATDVAPTAPGLPCGVNEQGEPIGGCSGGQFCIPPTEGFPNGYCAPDCRMAPCPEGAECYPSTAAHHYCLRGCATDGDCRVREGYVCRAWRPGARAACIPNEEPIGRRDDGRACYASGGDGGVGPFLAPLPTVTFATPSINVSRGMFETIAEAETSIAIDPDGHAVVAFMGLDNRRLYWRGGVARLSSDGVMGAITPLHDFDYPNTLIPGLAFDHHGRLHLVYVGDAPDRPGNFLRHTVSLDGGASFARETSVLAGAGCGLGCTSPSIAVGPDAGAGEAVYASALAGQRDGSSALVFARMPVEGTAFDPSSTLATLEVTGTVRRAPGIASLSAGPRVGAVNAVWVARNVDNALAALGDRANRVRTRSSSDGGRTWAPAVDVMRDGDAPVGQVPWVASGGTVTHVVYVTGGVLGAWDVVLATRRDGESTWQYRVVNDDPDRCATHAFAGLAVDSGTGDAHVMWLDNRYGSGIVAYARCPADASQRCQRNELVSGESFVFTTATDPLRWHGTRSSLARSSDGALWAAWSDTRSGGPGIYVSRGGP